MGKVVWDTSKPEGQRGTGGGNAYQRGVRDGVRLVVEHLEHGRTLAELREWRDGPVKAWVDAGDGGAPVPQIGGG